MKITRFTIAIVSTLAACTTQQPSSTALSDAGIAAREDSNKVGDSDSACAPILDELTIDNARSAIQVGAGWRSCKVPEDCVVAATSCDGCCEHDAISSDLTQCLAAALPEACSQIESKIKCDCAPEPAHAICNAGRCELVPDTEVCTPEGGACSETSGAGSCCAGSRCSVECTNSIQPSCTGTCEAIPKDEATKCGDTVCPESKPLCVVLTSGIPNGGSSYTCYALPKDCSDGLTATCDCIEDDWNNVCACEEVTKGHFQLGCDLP